MVAPAQAVEGERRRGALHGHQPRQRPDGCRTQWTETVWLTTDRNRPNPGQGDRLLASFPHAGGLAVGAGYDRVVTVTLPDNVVSGNYYITPWTDPYDTVLEDTLADNINPDDPHEIDNNNYKARAIQVIGIPPTSSSPTGPGAGDRAARRSGGGRNALHRPLDDQEPRTRRRLTRAGQTASTCPTSPIRRPPTREPGCWVIMPTSRDCADEQQTWEMTFELSPATQGCFVKVIVDAWENVTETDESNNQQVVETDVTARPADLVVSDVVTQPINLSGERTTIRWTVTNVGLYPVSRVTNYWYDQVFLSRDATFIRGRAIDLGMVGHDSLHPLDPGESYSASLEATLPRGVEGPYYVHVFTNFPAVFDQYGNYRPLLPGPGIHDNDISRFRYYPTVAFEPVLNNYRRGELAITYREPDLQVAELIAPPSAASGETLSVRFTVSNAGTRKTREGLWYDRVFLSLDPTLDVGDLQLGDFRRQGGLEIGQSYTATVTVRLPDSIEGPFYLLAFADAAAAYDPRRGSNIGLNQSGISTWVDYVPEFQDEGNNITVQSLQVLAVTAPDLQVTAVSLPEHVRQGQAFDLTYVVTNRGGATPASQSVWTDSIYLSRDEHLDLQADRYLDSVSHTGGLGAGASYEVAKSWTLPADLLGPWYAIVATDFGYSNLVFEGARERNNTRPSDQPMLIELPPPVDLVVAEVRVPTSGRSGETVQVEWSVRNDSGEAVQAAWLDAVYLSSDTIWDPGDQLLGRTRYVGRVEPGQSYASQLDATLPAVKPGNYHVIVRADIFNQIYEGLNEANNRTTSADAIHVGVDAMELGLPYRTTLSTGQVRLLQVTVPANETLRVTLQSSDPRAVTELYLRHGDVPTSTQYDAAYEGGSGR